MNPSGARPGSWSTQSPKCSAQSWWYGRNQWVFVKWWVSNWAKLTFFGTTAWRKGIVLLSKAKMVSPRNSQVLSQIVHLVHGRLAFWVRNHQELGRVRKGTSEILETGRLGRMEQPLEKHGESHQLEGKMADTMIRFPKSSHVPRCYTLGPPGSVKELPAMNSILLSWWSAEATAATVIAYLSLPQPQLMALWGKGCVLFCSGSPTGWSGSVELIDGERLN